MSDTRTGQKLREILPGDGRQSGRLFVIRRRMEWEGCPGIRARAPARGRPGDVVAPLQGLDFIRSRGTNEARSSAEAPFSRPYGTRSAFETDTEVPGYFQASLTGLEIIDQAEVRVNAPPDGVDYDGTERVDSQ